MSFLKKRAVPFLAAALSMSLCTAVPANADYDPKPQNIKAVRATKTVTKGSEFELKVRTSPRDADEDYLRWTIVSGKKVVRFDDDDRVRATKTVTKGSEFELKVRTSPRDADEDYLRWTIVSGKKVVRFDDDDRTDDEIELKALRTGKAKLRCQIRGTNKKVYITVIVKGRKATPTISRIGAATRTVRAGRDFELKVKKSKDFDDDYLRWSIADPSIIRFDDDDRSDDEMEFTARKAGTTTIRCKNLLSGRSISYTVKVEPRKPVRFDDDDRSDDEMEFTARKAGTTTIRCKNLLSGRSISYTVKVEPRKPAVQQPDWDDDDDDWNDEDDQD